MSLVTCGMDQGILLDSGSASAACTDHLTAGNMGRTDHLMQLQLWQFTTVRMDGIQTQDVSSRSTAPVSEAVAGCMSCVSGQ
jgi:hypothetical protein